MGQYFALVNKTKKEVVCPWCTGTNTKAWEWCANNNVRMIGFLLAETDKDHSGLNTRACTNYWFNGGLSRDLDRAKELTGFSRYDRPKRSPKQLMNYNLVETKYSLAGHWAGDSITLVGDYHSSGLEEKALKEYKDITPELVRQFNDFIELEDMKVSYSPCTIYHKNNNEPTIVPKQKHKAGMPDFMISTTTGIQHNQKVLTEYTEK